MTREQIWSAWEAFRAEQSERIGTELPRGSSFFTQEWLTNEVAADLASRSVGTVSIKGPIALVTGMMMAMDFGAYLARLERDEKELPHAHRPQS
jgi:hypothetical protein